MTTVVPAQTSSSAPSVTPAVSPGHRLVPAAIGRRNEAPQVVWIECPTTWCSENHLDFGQVAVEDIVHSSDASHFGVRSFLSKHLTLELYASIKSDPAATDPRLRRAHVVIDDGSGEDAFLTPDMADASADELIAFAMRMKDAARVARQANRVAGLA